MAQILIVILMRSKSSECSCLLQRALLTKRALDTWVAVGQWSKCWRTLNQHFVLLNETTYSYEDIWLWEKLKARFFFSPQLRAEGAKCCKTFTFTSLQQTRPLKEGPWYVSCNLLMECFVIELDFCIYTWHHVKWVLNSKLLHRVQLTLCHVCGK